MSDTGAEVEARVRTLLMKRSAVERLEMGFEMFETARAMMAAGLAAEGLERGTEEWRIAVLSRTYRDDLSGAQRQRFIEQSRAWEGRGRRGAKTF